MQTYVYIVVLNTLIKKENKTTLGKKRVYMKMCKCEIRLYNDCTKVGVVAKAYVSSWWLKKDLNRNLMCNFIFFF